ncbi:39S ribosomal protein S18a, mitochondrial [Copidosoma floridanum]|uniref:39S ribosomal protein S18a, mitochondrial n=1 Tax=Copidosoma floridanum TaxID=29053 RepID=UPI0006C97C10|nr:39S ribosomal protein S18a, mitochondrial [Copidosoma floridanum]
MSVSRLLVNFRKNLLQFDQLRSISLSAARNLKEIRETKIGNTTIVEAVYVPQEKENLFLKPKGNGACSLCSTNVDLKYTDVLILKQFLRKDGCMLPRRITGLCNIQQKRVGIMVEMARRAGLLGSLKPRHKRLWKGLNTYYDENTIKQRYY